jgi:hypothetical protein
VTVSAPVQFEGGESRLLAAVETPAMIDAGDYSASLEIVDGADLAVDSLRRD